MKRKKEENGTTSKSKNIRRRCQSETRLTKNNIQLDNNVSASFE
jgi:hypothetical protein